MNDKNYIIRIKNDYSDDELFMGLINEYYSQAELEMATKRIGDIVYPTVKKEVEKYQAELNQKYNQELKSMQLDYEKKIAKEQQIIEEERRKNNKVKKLNLIALLVVAILYLIFFILIAFNILK